MSNVAVPEVSVEKDRARLIDRLLSLNIGIDIVPYPVHSTVEEGKLLRGNMAGTFTKNLLVKDKKSKLFLLSIHEDRVLDLKVVAAQIGAKGHLSFVAAERMKELLGVVPGSLTPLGIVNDPVNEVNVVIDAALMGDLQLNFHPLVNTESIGLSPAELVAFVRSCGREPMIVNFDSSAQQRAA